MEKKLNEQLPTTAMIATHEVDSRLRYSSTNERVRQRTEGYILFKLTSRIISNTRRLPQSIETITRYEPSIHQPYATTQKEQPKKEFNLRETGGRQNSNFMIFNNLTLKLFSKKHTLY
jgi:hypothetical protein